MVLGLVWLAVSAVIAAALFLTSSRTVLVAGHDAEVSPTFDDHVVVKTGPVLPDLRMPSVGRIGVDIYLGKTEAGISTDALIERYGLIAAAPEGQIEKIAGAVKEMAFSAALRGLALGVIPVGVWLLLGRRRRRELARATLSRGGLATGVAVVLIAAAVWQPWEPDELETNADTGGWQPLSAFLGSSVPLPEEADRVEVRGDVTTSQTRRLIESVVGTYDKSKEFYKTAVEDAKKLELRQPREDETTVVMVSDRHDNVGMDPVARAIGDAAGATAVFDGGDDTSTGKPWEAFSLDSLSAAFGDLDKRWAVTGNHDNGTFVGDYLADQGWTVLNGEVVPGPGGGTLLGVPDPRSSGLGAWVDAKQMSKEEAADEVADIACEQGPVDTLLIHDVTIGAETLERGCATLVVGGHVHVTTGPNVVTGENGERGWSFTNGTTGGAAYAIAVGSKPKRPADVSVLTYRRGVPVGVQTVTLQTQGRFDVGQYKELDATVPGENGDNGENGDQDGDRTEGPGDGESTDEPTDGSADGAGSGRPNGRATDETDRDDGGSAAR